METKNNLQQLKKSFFNTAIADIPRAIEGGSIIGAYILTFCLIDYMGWIEYGGGPRSFNRWVAQRMGPIQNHYQYDEIVSELYSVRCGLIHTYGPSRHILKKDYEGYRLNLIEPSAHMCRINSGHLQLCLYSLSSHVIWAAHLAFDALIESHSHEQFLRAAQQLIIFNSGDVNRSYGEMHWSLAPLDSAQKINEFQCTYDLIFYPNL